jgi:hypothetical protein
MTGPILPAVAVSSTGGNTAMYESKGITGGTRRRRRRGGPKRRKGKKTVARKPSILGNLMGYR